MKRLSLLLVLFLCLARITSAQTQATSSSHAIAFVQSFYDWYLPIVTDDSLKERATDIVIKRRPELFDRPLLRALQIDAAAQAKADLIPAIDGLDGDPFVDTNGDPAPHFKAIRSTGSLVTVVGYDEQITKPLTSLTVEVRCKPNSCVIVNIHYPARNGLKKSDLLSILHLLHPHAKFTP
jgi:hypothetical protein